MKYRNIIFDLDGTLWDSRASIIENWNNVLHQYHLLESPLRPNDMNRYMGLLAKDVLKDLFPGISTETIDIILKEIIESEGKFIRKYGGALYENVIETLNELTGSHNLYIVSNAQDGYIEAFLDYFGIHQLFKDYESHGRTGKNKAENIHFVLERNQLSPSETVYVGDTETDYKSSMENNIDFIFCAYGFGKLNIDSSLKSIEQFNELLQIETL